MKIAYNPAKNPLVKNSLSFSFLGIELVAGVNEIPDGFKDSPDYALFVKSGCFQEVAIDAPVAKTHKKTKPPSTPVIDLGIAK